MRPESCQYIVWVESENFFKKKGGGGGGVLPLQAIALGVSK